MLRPVFTGKENMTHIVSTEKLTDSITALEIAAPEIAETARTGQVVMARLGDETKAHPRVIADFDIDKGTITLVIRKTAPDAGTHDGVAPDAAGITADASPEPDENSSIHIDGPLGKSSDMPTPGKALLVAEGMGIPAVFTRLRELKESGCYTMFIAGYPSKSELFWLDRLEKYCDEFYVITDDGSFGIKGPIRQTLKAVCDQVQEIEHVFAAGSMKLLKSTSDVTRPLSIPTTVNLAAVFDAPNGAAAPIDSSEDTTARIDWSGQINLDGHQVDFDELKKKLGLQIKK